jgi:Mg2+-importing ATPase
MTTFGLISSLFDFLTFAVLIWGLEAGVEQFRTGWFVESVVSASVIVLVIRTRRPVLRSLPGRPLLLSTLMIVAVTLYLPYAPVRDLLGLTALPVGFLLALGVLVALYGGVAELTKRLFFRKNGTG